MSWLTVSRMELIPTRLNEESMESSNVGFLRVPLARTNICFRDPFRQLRFFHRTRLGRFSLKDNSFRQVLPHALEFLPMVGGCPQSQIIKSHGFSAQASIPLVPPNLALTKFFAAENRQSVCRRKTSGI